MKRTKEEKQLVNYHKKKTPAKNNKFADIWQNRLKSEYHIY